MKASKTVAADRDVIASATCDVHNFHSVSAVARIIIRKASECDDGALRSDMLAAVDTILGWQCEAMTKTTEALDEHWLEVGKGGTR